MKEWLKTDEFLQNNKLLTLYCILVYYSQFKSSLTWKRQTAFLLKAIPALKRRFFKPWTWFSALLIRFRRLQGFEGTPFYCLFHKRSFPFIHHQHIINKSDNMKTPRRAPPYPAISLFGWICRLAEPLSLELAHQGERVFFCFFTASLCINTILILWKIY